MKQVGTRLLAAFSALFSFQHVNALANNATEPWYKRPFNMLQTNLRTIDADMDVNEIADFIASQGAGAWLVSIAGITANYPTKLPFQTFNPISAKGRESGDMLKDVLEAADARDLRVMGRVDFSKVSLPIAEAHPDWLFIAPDGTWQNHTFNVVSVCPNGGYYQERIFDILDEVTSQYELEGLFVNQIGFNENDYLRQYRGVCHCDNCKKRWAEDKGDLELPETPQNETYAEWKDWSNKIIDDWTARVRDFMHERAPNAPLILGGESDILYFEIHNALERDLWWHTPGEHVNLQAAWRQDIPILVNCASFNDYGYRISTENAHQYAHYHLQGMARGGNPSTYLVGTPDKIPWSGMDMAAGIMKFLRRHEDVYYHLRPISKTGLILPNQKDGTEEKDYLEWVNEYRGIFNMLWEGHIPFDTLGYHFILDMAENGGLERYKAIIVPDMGALSDDIAEALDKWAAAGGTLIVTGDVGVRNGSSTDNSKRQMLDGPDRPKAPETDPTRLGQLQLKSLPATSRIDFTNGTEPLYSYYMAPEQNRTEEGYYEGNVLPLLRSYSLYDWKEGTKGFYKKLDYAPFSPPDFVYGNVQVDEWGAGIGDYEDGRGVIITWPVGWVYRTLVLETHSRFFYDLWEELAIEQDMTFNISSAVEVTLNKNEKGDTVVHLLNQSGIRFKNRGPHLPIPAGSMKLVNQNLDGVTARALYTNQTLEVEEDGTILLPGLDLFEVILISGL